MTEQKEITKSSLFEGASVKIFKKEKVKIPVEYLPDEVVLKSSNPVFIGPGSGEQTPNMPVNADTLGGRPFSDYVLKADTTPALTYNLANLTTNSAAGTVVLNGSDVSVGVPHKLRWASQDKVLSGYSIIENLALSNQTFDNSYTFIKSNLIPNEASKLIAYSDSGEEFEVKVPTFKKSDKPKLYSFGLLSDTHIDGDGNDSSESESDLVKALTHFNKEGAEFAIINGDVTEDGRMVDLLAYQAIRTASTIPIYTVRGNHDTINDSADLAVYNSYVEPENGLYYKKIINNDVFLFMGMAVNSNTNTFSTTQMTWFETELETYRTQRVFVLAHIFISPVGNAGEIFAPSKEYSYTAGSTSERFLKAMRHYKNVIFISGHSHLDFSLQRLNETANYSDPTFSMCSRIHVPSNSSPRALSEGAVATEANLTTDVKGAYGYVVDVYEDHIQLKGFDYRLNLYLPLAQYYAPTNSWTVDPLAPTDVQTKYTTWRNLYMASSTGATSYNGTHSWISGRIKIDPSKQYELKLPKSFGTRELIALDQTGVGLGKIDYLESKDSEGYNIAVNLNIPESAVYLVVRGFWYPELTAVEWVPIMHNFEIKEVL